MTIRVGQVYRDAGAPSDVDDFRVERVGPRVVDIYYHKFCPESAQFPRSMMEEAIRLGDLVLLEDPLKEPDEAAALLLLAEGLMGGV